MFDYIPTGMAAPAQLQPAAGQGVEEPLKLQALYRMFGGPKYWASQGYTGSGPSMPQYDKETGAMLPPSNSDWADFVKSKGYGYDVANDASGFRHGQLTQNGQPVAGVPQAQWSQPDDTGFNITRGVVLAGLAAGGGMAAGAGGAGAGGTAAGTGGSAAGGNMALIESGLGTAGYGGSSAGTIALGDGLGSVASGALTDAGGSLEANGASEAIDGGTNLFEGANPSNIPPNYGPVTSVSSLTPAEQELVKQGAKTIGGKVVSPEVIKALAGVVGPMTAAIGGVKASSAAEKAASDATAAQAAAAAQNQSLGQQALDFAKQQYNDSKGMRDLVSQNALDVSNAQLAAQKQQTAIAADYDAYNKGTFRPVEKALVADAQGYDTPERRAAAVARSTADTESAYGSALEANNRALMRQGVTPGSGRSQTLMQDMALAKANAITGGTAQATQNIETQGHARMIDAASLGRNLPANQATAAATATTAGNSSVNSGTGALNATNSGVPAVQQGYSSAIGANYGAGNLYGQAANASDRSAAAEAEALGKFGTALGTYAGSADGSKTISDLFTNWLSDEDVKENTGKPADGEKALDEINATPVKEGWSYDPSKGGPDEGGAKHIGPMAQQVRRTMGSRVAPGGREISPMDMNGKLLAGMQALTRKVAKLERRAA